MAAPIQLRPVIVQEEQTALKSTKLSKAKQNALLFKTMKFIASVAEVDAVREKSSQDGKPSYGISL